MYSFGIIFSGFSCGIVHFYCKIAEQRFQYLSNIHGHYFVSYEAFVVGEGSRGHAQVDRGRRSNTNTGYFSRMVMGYCSKTASSVLYLSDIEH